MIYLITSLEYMISSYTIYSVYTSIPSYSYSYSELLLLLLLLPPLPLPLLLLLLLPQQLLLLLLLLLPGFNLLRTTMSIVHCLKKLLSSQVTAFFSFAYASCIIAITAEAKNVC